MPDVKVGQGNSGLIQLHDENRVSGQPVVHMHENPRSGRGPGGRP
jgi:hypothetical protein